MSLGPWEAYYVGCGDWDLKGPVTQEDWVLAAAAPDLLEALEDMLGWQTLAPDDVVAASIAKARGEK
jgi:hypothetical protein